LGGNDDDNELLPEGGARTSTKPEKWEITFTPGLSGVKSPTMQRKQHVASISPETEGEGGERRKVDQGRGDI